MIFHTPDPTFTRLSGCWKRATRFGKPGTIRSAHPLSIPWANCKLFLDAEDGDPLFSISCLDWFALRVDEFAQRHKIDSDQTLHAILHEWQSYMFFNPTKLNKEPTR
jgi:hypothetical protein